jgi:uncharacterized membrane protein YcaP (DUF421 family)
MKKEEIHLYDITRILFGQVPPVFYIELAIRTIVVYALVTFAMKHMGKRISAELDRTKLAAISTIAATTGLILLSPDRGLLPPIIVLCIIQLMQWFVNRKNYNDSRFETMTEGKGTTLVVDGVLQWKEMKRARVTKEQLFAQLRNTGIIHLGSVRRLYMEASGAFSFIENREPSPGLPVIPDWDTDFLAEQKPWNKWQVCTNCGNKQQEKETHCPVCGNMVWRYPVMGSML